MARHDVFANPDGPGWLLDVQADILHGLNTRIVVPLLPVDDAPLRAARLNPAFVIEHVEVSMVTQYLAAVPVSALRDRVVNLSDHHRQIIDALDMLFVGF
jgi:toxin CcdB